MPSRKIGPGRVALLCLAVFASVACFVFVTAVNCGGSGQVEFSETRWKQERGREESFSVRARMTSDVIRILERTRRRREDVVRLLGEPDVPSRSGNLSYWLGFGASAMPVDVSTLDVTFGPDGWMEHVHIVQH